MKRMLGERSRWTVAAAITLIAGCGARAGSADDVGGPDAPPGTPDARITTGPDATPDAAPCVEGDAHATSSDGLCYSAFITERVTRAVAASRCSMIGAHLATIRTAADNLFLTNLLGANEAFVGGTDIVTEGTFLWPDGTGLTYTNWRINEPNGPNEPTNGGGGYQEDCIVLQGQLGGVWDDRPCDSSELMPPAGTYYYLCER